MTSEQFIRSEKALQVLRGSDWVVARALEASIMGPEWCAWRDCVRKIAETGEGEIPPEPPRKVNVHAQAPAFVDVPAFLQDTPPHEVVDLINWKSPPKERQDALLGLLREVNGLIGLAEDRGGRAAPELYTRRDRIESGIRYNRATSVEEL